MSLTQTSKLSNNGYKIVSVLVCTHNGETFLEEQLDSIRRSTYPIKEIFIFDWASTDRTKSIVNQYTAIDPRIVLFEQYSAPGPAKSFMRAIERLLADGYEWDFLALSDQDDIWDLDKIQYQISAIVGLGQVDIVYTDVRIIEQESSNLSKVSHHFGASSYYRFPMNSEKDDSIFFSNPGIGMTMLLSRELCERAASIHRKSMRVMHDWFLMQVANIYKYHTICLPRSTVSYRQHHANILGAQKKKKLSDKLIRAKDLVLSSQDQLCAWKDQIGGCSFEFTLLQSVLVISQSKFLTIKGKFVLLVAYLVFFKTWKDR